mmetsp:Transcript_60847/g.157867  ORF Transcript_60847/g.157867 Transcript_60847/m.157867 type:complete len:210 (+) Transcript_60847:310-939(+)
MSASRHGTARLSSASRQPARCPACASRCRKPSRTEASKCAWYFSVSQTTSAPGAIASASVLRSRRAPSCSGISRRGGRRTRRLAEGATGSAPGERPSSSKKGTTAMEPRKARWKRPRYRGFFSTSPRLPARRTTSTPSKALASGGQSSRFWRRRPRGACVVSSGGFSSSRASSAFAVCSVSSGDVYGKTCSSGRSGGRWKAWPVSISLR